jgi:formylglycine-generating enzyme required for sulfatase activity
MYYLLTGEKPIPATDRVAEELKPPHHLNPGVSSQLSSAVMLAMELKSEHRFQQVSDMREALNMLEWRKEKPAKKQEKNTEEGIAPPPPIPKKGIGGKIAVAVLVMVFGIGIAYYIHSKVKANIGDGEQTGQTEKKQEETLRKQQEEEKKEQTEKEREEALRKQQEEEQRRKQEEQRQREQQEEDQRRKQEEQQQNEKQEEDQRRKQEEKRQREQQQLQERRRQEQLRNISAVQNLRNDMVQVQGGTFKMGCTVEQGGDCFGSEKPAHQVTLSSFHISKYEVTQALWKEVMGTNPSSFKDCDRCPVENVSWNDVQGFIRKLNQISGKNYRLPTEAEWEYAARGGSASKGYKYSGGNYPGVLGWDSGNSSGKTQPVGLMMANELGLYDMAGNVWEWCSDWYGGYSSGSESNPLGPSSGSRRVNRGGSWDSLRGDLRVPDRLSDPPGNRYSRLGFRLALSH